VLTNDDQDRIRQIVREELMDHWASIGRSEASATFTVDLEPVDDPDELLRAVERSFARLLGQGGKIRLMRDRDEPPAVDWL
jgi:hypothetical protein